ncbi:MAG: ATP11 protein-domain-containing protein [Monoraphidium minutum]|nr:MAG: ATP11 protein-domain-containing protein [Monoraphidium minutum]
MAAKMLQRLVLSRSRPAWQHVGAAAWPAADAAACGSGASSSASGSEGGAQARWRRSSFTMASPTKLEEIMHVDALHDKTADEIEQIWLEFHQDPTQRRVADVMGADEFKIVQARARTSPMFVLPLSKPGGFVTLLLNCQGHLALLTSVEEYKRFGAGAPPHMTITHYTELLDTKGLVLTRGDVINDAVVTLPEARTLLQLVRAFYTDPEAYRLVYQFNHEQERFSFDALLAQLGHVGGGGGGSGGGSGGSGKGGGGGGGGESGSP